MNGTGELLRDALAHTAATLLALRDDGELGAAFEHACRSLANALQQGGRIYTLGNGGSAADALHCAAELVGRLQHERRPLPAEALCADPVTLTALANDYGYAAVFSRQLEAKLGRHDAVLALSTSGRSENVVHALATARARGLPGILFTGRHPGPAAAAADCVVRVPDDDPKTVQEVHRLLLHVLCTALERQLFSHPSG
jgi:D-sedoheptulose 7-phosphate isomerase